MAVMSDRPRAIVDVSGYGAVALTVSGGLDSASLLYMIGESAKDEARSKKLKIYALTIPNRGDVFCGYYASLVVDFVQQRFGDSIEIEHIVKNIDMGGKHKTVVMEEFQKNLADEKLIDAFFDGVTLNPKDPAFQFTPPNDFYVERIGKRDYDPEVLKFEKKHTYHVDYCRPLANVDKRYIRDYLAERKIDQKLISMTRSCTDFTKVECGQCWWCAERKWAFSESAQPSLYSR